MIKNMPNVFVSLMLKITTWYLHYGEESKRQEAANLLR